MMYPNKVVLQDIWGSPVIQLQDTDSFCLSKQFFVLDRTYRQILYCLKLQEVVDFAVEWIFFRK